MRTFCVILILAVHGALLAWSSYVHAPTFDEVAHLGAGLSHWEFGTFEHYQVNPPLPRLIGTLPVSFLDFQVEWERAGDGPHERHEFSIGRKITELDGLDSMWYYRLARWACLPYSLLGGWFCYRWAATLFGYASGLVALVLWCVCPNVLAWGAAFTPDVPAAATGVMAGYAFWHWLRKPTWGSAVLAALALGLAEVTKTTWIVLFALWPVLWLATSVISGPREPKRSRWREGGQLAVMLLVTVYLINLAYAFEGSFTQLGEFQFISGSLGGKPDEKVAGNRFQDSPLGALPVPLPARYVLGIDMQKFDFETGKWSYLRGRQKLGGWYHYYLYALSVKTPLGTLVLAALALVLAIGARRYRLGWRDELVVLAPAVVVLLLVSSQTGFSRYLRYVIPALPFLFVSVARVGLAFAAGPAGLRAAVALLLATSTVGSLWVFPHSMSYFNLLAGGPRGGPNHLLDANVDWGQDLLLLKWWIDEHPQASPMHVRHFGLITPEMFDVKELPVPKLMQSEDSGATYFDPSPPQPGWYAVSVNDVYGYRHYAQVHDEYTYFRQLEPVDRVGYSIYIYHLKPADAERLAREFQKVPAAGATDAPAAD